MADIFDDEMEQTVTIGEYIKEMEAEELEADLVLGGDEGKECTYMNGYMKRQAVFSCLTCVPTGNAGVCTACVLSCHDGHEVVELWTKRNFKCDCGNSKFGGFNCKLCSSKDDENIKNSYNQNFKGTYCICGRPYPDPEAEDQVEMIQCCICEDWYHENHLGLDSADKIPREEDGEPLYDEYICQDCSLICSFLDFYPPSIWATTKQKNAMITSDEETELGSKKQSENNENGVSVSAKAENSSNTLHDSEKKSSAKCFLGRDLNNESNFIEKKRPMFLSKNWRGLLCQCNTCCEFYNKKSIGYLIDKEDTMQEYERIAKEKREEKLQKQEGAELKFFNTLDHVQKIEILNGISDMKNEFHSFLESRDASKPITSDDVRCVFENLSKKRQRWQ